MRRVTKSTITRERIAQIANPDAWVKCSHEEVQELAHMALAAMDSEPVAWVSQSNLDALSRGHDALVKSTDNVVQPVPLYRHAQPAPVVPEKMLCDFYEVNNWTDLVRELVKHVEQLQDSARRNVKPWEDTFPETLLPAYIERIKHADEACRAAMLNRK